MITISLLLTLLSITSVVFLPVYRSFLPLTVGLNQMIGSLSSRQCLDTIIFFILEAVYVTWEMLRIN